MSAHSLGPSTCRLHVWPRGIPVSALQPGDVAAFLKVRASRRGLQNLCTARATCFVKTIFMQIKRYDMRTGTTVQHAIRRCGAVVLEPELTAMINDAGGNIERCTPCTNPYTNSPSACCFTVSMLCFPRIATRSGRDHLSSSYVSERASIY